MKSTNFGSAKAPSPDDKLSAATKAAVDEWIRTNKFNSYGDPAGTVYPGGSPLFDETTGRQWSRYEYILEKHKAQLTNLPANALLSRTNLSPVKPITPPDPSPPTIRPPDQSPKQN